MGAPTVALLVIVGVIVAAIALHLIAIAASLLKITRTLTSVKGGVHAIKGQTDPIGTVVGGLAADVAAIDDDLEGLLVLVGEAGEAEAAIGSVLVAEAGVDVEELVASRPRPTMREAVARARTASRN